MCAVLYNYDRKKLRKLSLKGRTAETDEVLRSLGMLSPKMLREWEDIRDTCSEI